VLLLVAGALFLLLLKPAGLFGRTVITRV